MVTNFSVIVFVSTSAAELAQKSPLNTKKKMMEKAVVIKDFKMLNTCKLYNSMPRVKHDC